MFRILKEKTANRDFTLLEHINLLLFFLRQFFSGTLRLTMMMWQKGERLSLCAVHRQEGFFDGIASDWFSALVVSFVNQHGDNEHVA